MLQLEMDPVNPTRTALVVTTAPGTNSFLRVHVAPSGGVIVLDNNTPLGTFQPTGHIIVYANGAIDNVEVAGFVTLPSMLFGGTGNGTLYGGGGPNVIVGGSGTIVIYGRKTSDLLIGGAGRSEIIGRGGNDLEIAGTTSFDNNIQALAAILAEWSSSDSYATRVADLTGQGSGQGQDLNGNYFLQAGSTVLDDGLGDTLIAGSGRDLLFARIAGGGVLDQVNGLLTGDLLLPL
jgi:Ca2+-binding RTX toxin-like protein